MYEISAPHQNEIIIIASNFKLYDGDEDDDGDADDKDGDDNDDDNANGDDDDNGNGDNIVDGSSLKGVRTLSGTVVGSDLTSNRKSLVK